MASVSPPTVWNSTGATNFTMPIHDDPLLGPYPAAEYDPVARFLPFLVLILTLFLFGSTWSVTHFPSTFQIRNANPHFT